MVMLDLNNTGMLAIDPTKRLEIEDVLENAWLEGGVGALFSTSGRLNRSHRREEDASNRTLNAFKLQVNGCFHIAMTKPTY